MDTKEKQTNMLDFVEYETEEEFFGGDTVKIFGIKKDRSRTLLGEFPSMDEAMFQISVWQKSKS